jgi:7-cyano-7-deazaguanine synthase in queuosine biosynthesis
MPPGAGTPIEEEIAALCAEVSPNGGPRPGPDSVLAELGFDSLAAADLAVSVEERFGVRLAACDVTSLRTVRDIARAVEGRPLEIRTPLIHCAKAEIVRLGVELGAPLELTWSCYRGQARPCLSCDACTLRAKGFADAGLADPALR